MYVYSPMSGITGIFWEHVGLSSTRKPLSGFRMLCTGEGACWFLSTLKIVKQLLQSVNVLSYLFMHEIFLVDD